MAKTKKKEVQKQGLRPSQKAKAEKLRKKQEAKAKVKEEKATQNASATALPKVDTTSKDTEAIKAHVFSSKVTKSSKSVAKKSLKTTKNIRKTSKVSIFPSESNTSSSLKTIHVKNAEGDPDTVAEILIQNKIDYTPKVSVVMPVYNVEPYLRQTLDSVINQTLKEIEIICVDDGSTDASLDILKEYAAKDNRITVITQNNAGSGKARNNAMDNSKGEFIAFMDSDDMYPSDKTLEHIYEAAIKNNVLICGGSLSQLREGDVIVTNPKEFEEGYSFNKEGLMSYADYQFDYGYWRFIYSRQFLKENQLYFPDYLRGQDPPFFIKSMCKARYFYALIEPTYTYRISYKKIQWTKRKILDSLKGYYDCVFLAKKYKMQKLYENIINRLNNKYYLSLLPQFTRNSDVIEILNKISQVDNRLYTSYTTNRLTILPFYPKVSIIIPVYNVEKYLRQCLDSVINQTLKEIEIICIDDASPDNSIQILKEYAKKDERISIIHQENQGLGKARNTGIQVASAPYVFYLDSDDWIDITCIEKLYNKITSCNAELCIYGMNKYDNQTGEITTDDFFNTSMYQKRNKDVCTYKEIKSAIFTRFGAVFKLYKTSFIKENNLFFPVGVVFEDVVIHNKALLSAKKICFVDENLYYYRRNRDGSIMFSTKENTKIFDMLLFLQETLSLLKTQNLYEELKYEYLNFILDQTKFHLSRVINEIGIQLRDKINDFIKSNELIKDIEQFDNLRYLYQSLLCDQPKISIIIPVYNVEKYLRQCLDSVINQTLKEIEIICIDDGSTDASLDILKEYAEQDCRIKIITQKNQRQGTARNNGIKVATGKYIQFLDADDYLILDACEKLYNKLQKYNLDMLSFGGQNFLDNTKELLPSPYYSFLYLPKNWDKEIFSYKDCYSFLTHMAVSAALTIYRHSFLLEHHIVFPEKIYFEDNVFFIKSVLAASKISILKDKLYFRRLHEKSTTANWNNNYKDFLIITEMIIKYVQDNHPELDELYRKAYLNSCINIWKKFNKKDKKKYTKELKGLLKKHNFNNMNIKNQILQKFIYCFFPFYLVSLLILRKKYLKLQILEVKRSLHPFRLDIKNFGTEKNSLEISCDKGNITEPKWYTDSQGIGKMLQGNEINNTVRIKVIKDGILKFDFRGQDKRFGNKRFPLWIDYKSIKIDGKEILSEPINTWHNQPYRYEIPVKDGQEITLVIEQQYHQYTESQLKDILSKINSDNKFIHDNMEKIITELKKQWPIIDESIYKKREIEKFNETAIRDLISFRLDIKNFGTEKNSLEISCDKGNITEPKWYTDSQGIGKMLQGNEINNTVRIKVIKDGILKFDFRGQDKRFGNKRFPLWIDYKSIKINKLWEILSKPIVTWHDQPYRYEMPVKDGQEITLVIEQQYHQYTKNELKDVLLKLYPNDDFVKENLETIITEILKKMTILSHLCEIKGEKVA